TSSADDQPGEYEITVLRDGEELATDSFSLAAGQTTPEETPEPPQQDVTITVDPQTLAQGENVVVTVDGLVPGEMVTLDVLYDGENVFSTERTADDNGQAVLALVSSADDSPGEYSVVVTRDGEELGAVSFDLTEGTTEETPPEQVAEAQVVIDPASGARGTVHIIEVTGLEAGETVELQVVFNEETIFSTFLTANDEGKAGTQLVSEETDEVGDYTINILRGDRVIGSGMLTIEEAVTEGQPEEQPEQEQEGDTESQLGEGDTVAGNTSQIISGRLTQEEPEQRITITGEEGDTILISLNSTDFDTYLTLLDDQGSILTSNDDSNQSLNSQIGPFTLPYSGEYTILASSYSYSSYSEVAVGQYELTIERVGLSDIAYGDTVDVNFTADSFTQFFSFEAAAGDVISVTVDSGGSVDTVLSLLDPDGYSLFTDDDGGAGLDPEMMRFVIPNSGTYVLTLRAFTPGAEGSASLTLNRNDVRTLDQESRTVVLNGKQSRDVLTLTGEAGEAIQLNIAVESGNPGDLNVSVVQNGQSLMYYQSYGIPSEITLGFVLPDDGEVTIFVEDYSGAASTFTVSIERE
ncbi:MAG: PPC domain-containing protein, partial [Anaerolineae bacterium]|nr:PPC domain-containing protein [Anaerolineae bacterium]